MSFHVEQDGSCHKMAITGRFTFGDHTSFRDLLMKHMPSGRGTTFIIDLKRADYIDSAGLGMFLLARDQAKQRDCRLLLRGAQGQVSKMMAISKFDDLFECEP